jgi:L-lactate dehydrogenase complex protein LldF
MKIPLPRMLRTLRERQFDAGLGAKPVRYGLGGWAFLATRPALYRLATRLGVGAVGLLGRKSGRLRRMPFAGGWTSVRDLPAPQGRTFHDLWRARSAGR